MQNSFEENQGKKLIEARLISYYTKKLQKSTILESQQQRICAQMILNHLHELQCEKHLLEGLENFFNQKNGHKRGHILQANDLNLKNLISTKLSPSHESVIQKMLQQYIARETPEPKRQSRFEHIKNKSQSLQQLNGGRVVRQEYISPVEYMRKLKTCFGHALHPDNQDQEDPYIPVYNVIYDRTGQLLLTGDDLGLIKIWSASNGLLLQSLKGHTMAINSMDISYCNKYLASCSNDGLVIVWDIQIGKPVAALKEAQDDPILVLVFYQSNSENVNYLTVASEKGYVYIYDVQDLIKCNGSILGTQFNTKIKQSAIKHEADIIRLNVNYNKSNKGKVNGILCMEFNKQGYLAMGTDQGEIIIFDKPENLSKAINKVEWREHSGTVHLARWSKDGDQLLTASFDGSARLWKWQEGGIAANQHNRSQVLLKYKSTEGRRVGEIQCFAIAWSAKSTYALASFSKKLKKKGDEEKSKTQIQVYSTHENQVIHCMDQESLSQLKLDSHVVFLEAHPIFEEVALSADENGLIILWNVQKGIPLKVFHERGYHLKLPNLEVPLKDGCFSPNGMTFVVSTDYGSFSIYGYGVQEIFDQTPVEQFYVSDSEHPIIDESDGFRVMALDSDMEFCYVDRGSICNFYRMPYHYHFQNNFKTLFPYLISQDYQGKKSVNLQKPKLFTYIQMSKGITIDNMKNEEMFQGYFAEMKQMEIKIIHDIKEQMRIQDQVRIQKLEGEIIDVANQPIPERSPSNHNVKLIKKTEQKSGELIKRALIKDDEDSSSQISQQVAQQSINNNNESKKQSQRRKKVIESESESEEKISKQSNQNMKEDAQIEQSPLLTRSRRNQRNQQSRLVILNSHRQQNDLRRNRSQVTEQCTRCRILMDNVVRCPECKSAFHQECSEIRLFVSELDFGTQKRICINCMAQFQRKKQAQTRQGDHVRDKYLTDDTNSPQIGDDVIFFTKGYEQYLQKCLQNLDLSELSIDSASKKTIVFPGDVLTDQESANFAYCKVLNINYIFPVINTVFKRQVNQNSYIIQVFELQTKDLIFKCFYSYDCDPYLILEESYASSVRQIRPYLNQQQLSFQTDADKDNGFGHQYQFIAQETPDVYLHASDWQVLKCKRISDDTYQLRNQKSMIAYCHLNFWEIASMVNKSNKPIEIQGASLQSALTTNEAQQINKDINAMIKKQTKISFFFSNEVDVQQYPEYLDFVPLMSYITLIQRRLENDFYRSKDQILNDVERIRSNAYIFNPPKSEVCELADKLANILHSIVNGDQIQKQQVIIQVREIQTRKKKKLF
ncbi:unnamed protein product [Paramecium octaurelia]|uniref:Bromo domain-containing protein n=1 Tax=Paramecium octaurelia TaxID=43137 RepID=A0A8S1V5K2_PAROT|nr:unnamed protein product [Paramecium octaurelia]